MKQHTVRIAIITTCLGLSAQAAPFMAVGDNAELFVTASAQVQFDDNIYLDPGTTAAPEVDDTILSFTPGVDLVFGKGAVTKGNAYYREEIRRYTDNDNQDTELSSLGFNSRYDNGVTKADFNASYAQVAQNDNDVITAGTIVRRKLTHLGARLEFGLSEKTSLSAGANFDKTDYGPSGYSDSSIWTLPVDLYYKASPKLDWSVGYRFRDSNLSAGGTDSTDHFLNVGARGEFTPKLVGQVRIGLAQRSFDVGDDDTQLGFDSNLTYAFSEKTTYRFNMSNDFGSSGTGVSTETFSIGLMANTRISEQWAFTGGLSLKKTDYPSSLVVPGRSDDYLEGLLAVTYTLNTMVNFGASVVYRDNGSSAPAAEFTNSVFTFGANIRY
jgi:hypothetical protein